MEQRLSQLTIGQEDQFVIFKETLEIYKNIKIRQFDYHDLDQQYEELKKSITLRKSLFLIEIDNKFNSLMKDAELSYMKQFIEREKKKQIFEDFEHQDRIKRWNDIMEIGCSSTNFNKELEELKQFIQLINFTNFCRFKVGLCDIGSDFGKLYSTPIFFQIANITKFNNPNISCLTVSHDGKVVCGQNDGIVKIWLYDHLKPFYEMKCFENKIFKIIFDYDENMVVISNLDSKVKVWNKDFILWEFNNVDGHKCFDILKLNFDSIIVSFGNEIRLFTLLKGCGSYSKSSFHTSVDGYITSMILSFDGNIVMSTKDCLYLVDCTNFCKIKRIEQKYVKMMCLLSSGRVAIVCKNSKCVKILDKSTLEEIYHVDIHSEDITCIKLWNGNLITASLDCTVKVWDGYTLEFVGNIPLKDGMPVMYMETMKNGNLVLSDINGIVTIWTITKSTF